MTVEVFFVDAATGKAFAQASMPPESLPETFARDTTLDLAGQDWRVVKAEPLTAREFTRTGKLVLTLEKVVSMPARDILYTLPTICDEIPGIAKGTTKQGKNIFEMHEDDWRQIELVSRSYLEMINSQFSEIVRIFKDHGVRGDKFLGFRDIYVRKGIKAPIQTRFALSELYAVFPASRSDYDGFAYRQGDGLIAGGFAFGIDALTVYGQQIDGLIKALGIQFSVGKVNDSISVAAYFETIMAVHNLCLVDWCGTIAVNAEIEDLRQYLGERR
jgi:hypothetical protein